MNVLFSLLLGFSQLALPGVFLLQNGAPQGSDRPEVVASCPCEVAQAAPQVDPRMSAFVAFISEVTANVTAAASGQPTDPRFNEVGGGGDGLNQTPPETVAEVTQRGGIQSVHFTALEIEAIAQDAAGGPRKLELGVVVMPDGSVLLIEGELESGEVTTRPSEGLRETAPALAQGVDWLLETLSNPSCQVGLLGEQDLSSYPEDLREEVDLDRAALTALCANLAAVPATWQPRVDDLSVIVVIGGQYFNLRSGFEVNDGHLSLGKVRLRSLD